MDSTKDIALFKDIFQFSKESILVIDLDGFILEANAACEILFKYKLEELLNKTVERILPNTFQNKPITLNTKLFNGINGFGQKKDATKFPIEITCKLSSSQKKEVLIVYIKKNKELTTLNTALRRDKNQLASNAFSLEKEVFNRTSALTTTVQKLVASNISLEDQIQETQNAEKNALISKSLSLAIAKNFPKGFIIVFNSAFEILLIEGESVRNLGLDKITIASATVSTLSIFSKNQKEQLKDSILSTLAGKHLGFEITHEKQYFSVNTIPLIGENTKISSALFVFSNITVQKKIEQDSRSALKKERELNELKSRFISMASHEFRTPLSAIQTSAILIGKQNENGHALKREKYVAQIKKNVKQLVVILNDFLSLSKLEEGKVKASKELFDLVKLCNTIIKEISLTKKLDKNIVFLPPKNCIPLNLDAKLVRNIFINLLSNALKYSPEKTDIIIKIKEKKHFVFLKVKDYGIGIPKKEQAKLFQRFFRAKNALDIQGTGLGLNIVKQYATLMHGTITFKSKENKGTTFTLKLPKPVKK